VIEYAATCDKSIIEDVFDLPPNIEETLDPFMSSAEPNNGSNDNHSNEPSVEVAAPEEASNVVSGDDEELMEIETDWTLDNYHVASADPPTMSKKSPSSALSEILLTVNDNSEPLLQHPTNLGKPAVSSSIRNTSTLDVDIDDYLVPPPMSKTDVNFTSTTSVSPSTTLCLNPCRRLTSTSQLPILRSPFPSGTQTETLW